MSLTIADGQADLITDKHALQLQSHLSNFCTRISVYRYTTLFSQEIRYRIDIPLDCGGDMILDMLQSGYDKMVQDKDYARNTVNNALLEVGLDND